MFQTWWLNFILGEVNEDCVPFSSFVEDAYDLVIRTTTGTNEQKKSCPKIAIRTSGTGGTSRTNVNPVELRAYLGYEKEVAPQLPEISRTKCWGNSWCTAG